MGLAAVVPPPAPDRSAQLRRAVIASVIGSTIEWYDFFLYGVAAALVFPKVFFPTVDPFVSTLTAFSTYFVGFAARPLGAAIFGHFGDRIGRKATLVTTLLLMGLSTVAIGLLPGYATLGIWAGVILVVLRTLQGIGVGGEWGGAVLVTMEWGSSSGKRGLLTSGPQFGVALGLVLANGAVAMMNNLAGPGFLEWGWRLPFLASVALIGAGLWIRLGLEETPVFAQLKASDKLEKTPVKEVLRLHWREVLLTALARTGSQGPYYIFTTYVLVYGTEVLKADRALLLSGVMAASMMSMVTLPLWAMLSDKVGRRNMILAGAAAMALWGFAYFTLLDTRLPAVMMVAVMLSLPIHDMQFGPLSAFIAESFTPRLRYSGASLGYQLSCLTAGGPAPLIALYLMHRTHSSTAIACYIGVSALITIVAVLLLPDRTHQDCDREYDEVPA
ncbi:MAG: transporter [Cyanobacteria bacterium RYN_339]|nr:transporter [Cyanobacteria bacterium RYN_339]